MLTASSTSAVPFTSCDQAINPEYDVAFKDSDSLIFETDVAANDASFQQQLLMQMSLPPGQTLADQLQPQTYQRLQNFAAAKGLPIAVLTVLNRPWPFKC